MLGGNGLIDIFGWSSWPRRVLTILIVAGFLAWCFHLV